MIILSIDPASRTLGYTVIELDENIFNLLTPEYYNSLTKSKKKRLDPPLTFLESLDYIKILECNVISILDKKYPIQKTTKYCTRRSRNLRVLTRRLKDQYDINRVYIEMQPLTLYSNHNTRVMENIRMEFIDYDIHIVNARLKNKIYYQDNLIHQDYVGGVDNPDNYPSNKSHSKDNFLFACDKYDIDPYSDVINNITGTKRIKSKKLDDVADAFNQIVGALFFHNHIIE